MAADELTEPRALLPHKPPFLFIDAVTEVNDRSIRAHRTFRPDEDFFRGHFPDRPIVPGVLLIEAMAQTFAYLIMHGAGGDLEGVYLTGIDRARFRQPVLPGQRVELFVEIQGERLGLITAKAVALVAGKKVADARLTGRAAPSGRRCPPTDGRPDRRQLEVRSGEPRTRTWDAIIIGSGMSGLTSALLLAKEGMRVIVLEQHYRPGGFLHRFSRKGGVEFDVGFHYLGGVEPDQVLGIYFAYLGILDQIDFLPLDPEGYDEVIFPHTRFLIPAGEERLIARFTERFPKQGGAIARYFAEQRDICAGFGFYNIQREQNETHVLRWLGERLGEYMRRYFDDRELIQILQAQSPLYGVEPERTPVALHALVTDSFRMNPYAIRGGGEGIVRPMIARIEELGGEVRIRCRVESIVVDDQRCVRGVRTTNGEELHASYVLSSAHPKATVRMLPEKALRRGYRRRVLAMEDGVSNLSLFVTTPVDLSSYKGRNIYNYDVRNVADIYERRAPSRFVFCTVPTAREGRSKAGMHHVVGLGMMPWEHVEKWEVTRTGSRGDEYEAYKQQRGEELLELIYGAIPELRGNVSSFEVATPLTNRDYTNSERGATYGIHHSVDQVGRYGLRPRTRVSGLYMTGQSILMPGVCGVTISAFHTCAQILGQDYLIGKVQAHG